MSRTLQIRHVPDAVHRTLKERAAAAGLSLSDFLLEEVTRVAERPPIADVLARAASRGGGAAAPDLVDAVRAGRDRS